VTIRPASTALLTIDSEDRFNNYTEKRRTNYADYNGSPYNFTITKDESLMNGFFTRMAVTEVVFPTNGIPNINTQTNDIRVYWFPTGGPEEDQTVTIPVGFYTPHALASTIQSVVAGTDPSLSSFTMTYGLNSQGIPSPQFHYITNNATKVAFEALPYNSQAYPYPDTTRQLFDLLGMGPQNQPTAGLPTVTGGYTGTTTCQGTRYVDIVCSQLCYNQPLKDASSQSIVRDSLCRLYLIPNAYENTISPNDPNYAPPGTVPTTIYRNFTLPKQIAWSPNQPMGQLTFEIYDDNGSILEPVTQTNGTSSNIEWSMTLQVTEN